MLNIQTQKQRILDVDVVESVVAVAAAVAVGSAVNMGLVAHVTRLEIKGPGHPPAVMSVKTKSKWGLLVRGATMKMAFSKALTALLGQHNRPDHPGAVGAVSV